MEPTTLVVQLVALGVYMGIEYWLGKTDKVKAASVVEAIVLIASKLKGKKDEPKTGK
jgi:hypothetical protein